jgi:hypothetical protein
VVAEMTEKSSAAGGPTVHSVIVCCKGNISHIFSWILWQLFTSLFICIVFLCPKGAPEVLERMLVVVPNNYATTYRYHMSAGRRVIALAYKVDEDYSLSKIKKFLFFIL